MRRKPPATRSGPPRPAGIAPARRLPRRGRPPPGSEPGLPSPPRPPRPLPPSAPKSAVAARTSPRRWRKRRTPPPSGRAGSVFARSSAKPASASARPAPRSMPRPARSTAGAGGSRRSAATSPAGAAGATRPSPRSSELDRRERAERGALAELEAQPARIAGRREALLDALEAASARRRQTGDAAATAEAALTEADRALRARKGGLRRRERSGCGRRRRVARPSGCAGRRRS